MSLPEVYYSESVLIPLPDFIAWMQTELGVDDLLAVVDVLLTDAYTTYTQQTETWLDGFLASLED